MNNVSSSGDVYTYLLNGLEYNTLAGARLAAPSVAKVVVGSYDACEFHGESEIGLNNNNQKVYEIFFLMNHRHCNPYGGRGCGYDK